MTQCLRKHSECTAWPQKETCSGMDGPDAAGVGGSCEQRSTCAASAAREEVKWVVRAPQHLCMRPTQEGHVRGAAPVTAHGARDPR